MTHDPVKHGMAGAVGACSVDSSEQDRPLISGAESDGNVPRLVRRD